MLGSIGGNILGTLYFIYFQVAGILIMAKVLKEEKPLTCILLGSVTGSALLQWVPVVFAFFCDFTLVSHVLAALAVVPAYIVALRERKQLVNMLAELPKGVRHHALFFVLLTGTMVLWVYILNTHVIPVHEDGAIYTGQCTYGDMNMHLSFVSSIANQGTFPPEYALFPGEKLSYPFLSDSISSSIYLMGASLRYAYILPMLTAFLQVVGGVYLLAMTLFGSRAKALLTYILYFFNGGLGFIYFIDWAKTREFTVENIFTGYYTTPTNLVNHNIRWVNIIADMLIPQRATLFGYAVLFSAIWLLYRAVFNGKKSYFLPAGIIVSMLPMIHTHSFLGMAFVSAAWLLVYLYRAVVPVEKVKLPVGLIVLIYVVAMCFIQRKLNKGELDAKELLTIGLLLLGSCILCGIIFLVLYIRKNGWKHLVQTWGVYLGCVLVLAMPQLFFWTFGQATGDNFVRGNFNWGNQGDFYPWFYLKNIGLPLVLIVAGVCAKRKKSSHLLLPAFVIWFVVDLIVFQPNVYDNNKLLYIAYLLLCLVAADYGVELYRKLRSFGGARWFAGIFLFGSVFSAALTLGREAVSEYQLYGAADVRLAQFVDEHTEKDAVILTHTHHNNAIASLTGRNIVCGSDAFLYFHGYDTRERQNDIRQMYEFPVENLALYEEYNVSYVAVSNWERGNYAVNETALQEMFDLVYSQEGLQLYSVK